MTRQILDAEKIIETIDLLGQRIAQRFPDSNLRHVCAELLSIAQQSQMRAEWISRPIWGVRIVQILLLALVATILIVLPTIVGLKQANPTVAEFLQASEASLNEIVIIGAAIFFLVQLETRIKRRRALRAIHELRSVAHVIDMHQLTKDPERLVFKSQFGQGPSPKLDMTMFQLRRYLDYSSEMLSLVGKIAALYTQSFEDSVTLQSVNEVEDLSTGLSRKIWQKIMILYEMDRTAPNNTGKPIVPT